MSLIPFPDRAAFANLAAEARAVEEGHQARYDAARHCFLVRSDSGPRTYELRAEGRGGYVVVSCTCPAGIHRCPPAGVLACKHGALVARRLERMGLARWDGGRWLLTPRAVELGGEAA